MLTDAAEPVPLRAEAAESIAYFSSARAVSPLISVLGDPNPAVRFWAVFALGHSVVDPPSELAPRRRRVISALESALEHSAEVEGWWSIRQEALAVLGEVRPAVGNHKETLRSQVLEVRRRGDASPGGSVGSVL